MIEVVGLSHLGNVRSTNEDAMVWDLDMGFVAVADGMGGHQAGEVASALALESVLNFMRKSAETDDFTWPYGVDPGKSLTANRLITALRLGNRRVFKRSEEVSDYTGMGTTVVALVSVGSSVTYVSVGDSRLYTFQDGQLIQRTRDDTWVTIMSETPNADLEALRHHPMRNVLTNVVGARPELQVTASEIALSGERVLLCTDGLHSAVTHDQMTEILAKTPDPRAAVEALVHAALQAGGRDNVTVALVTPAKA